jgi:hypothetical protein
MSANVTTPSVFDFVHEDQTKLDAQGAALVNLKDGDLQGVSLEFAAGLRQL